MQGWLGRFSAGYVACRGKTTPPVPGDDNCRCQNQFGMDDQSKGRLNSFT